jgi:hypothetical protein
MLNSILKKLNGHAVESSALSNALAQLAEDRREVEAELERLQTDRHTALLNDADDKTLDAIERKIDRATVRLEKIGLAEPPLREQFANATAAERARRWAGHVAAHRAAAAEFLTAAREAYAAHASLLAIMKTARAEGFEHDIAAGMPPTPNINGSPICNPSLLDSYERALTPAPRKPGRAPRGGVQSYVGQPGASHYDPTKPPGPSKPTLQHAIVVDGAGQEISASRGPMSAPALPDDETPLRSGEVRAIVLRRGFTVRGQQCQTGRKVTLERDVALKAAQSGAVSILEDPVGAEAERLSERTFKPVGSISEAHGDPTIVGRQ